MENKGFIDSFARIETKYFLSQEEYRRLRRRVDRHMREDDYGLTTIVNIYFDTDDYELIRTSLEKPVYKEKLRLRSYGVPKETDTVFVEIKKKYDGLVGKRRIGLPMRKARNYLEHGIHPETDSQIGREIDWFLSRYRLEPKTFIGYDRIATFSPDDPELRITYDFNIRSRENELDLTAGDSGDLLLPEGQVLMEIKTGSAYPLWLSNILSEGRIYPVSFSKYGCSYLRKTESARESGNAEHLYTATA
ncbi:MAG: polyphosphate polymerase domain-containing protein [Lachnospiraceae bacterium]|jgi:hypothetical protein|nr:polyphosphate polymerase domain-containing protein [Lachnospiraceae bacterium]